MTTRFKRTCYNSTYIILFKHCCAGTKFHSHYTLLQKLQKLQKLHKLQKLQNRAARVLTYSGYDTDADSLIKKLGWKKLDSQRKLQKATMVYKSLNGLAPDYMRPIFVDRSSNTNYVLRDTVGKLVIPGPRTNYLKNSFGYSGAVLWNSLPAELRTADTLSGFKSGCNSYFNF